MANNLLRLGHDVRIACRTAPFFSKQKLKKTVKDLLLKTQGVSNSGWIQEFEGQVLYYTNPDQVPCAPQEIAIAVGTFTIHDVYYMKQDVIKIRYCHGYNVERTELMNSTWGLPMPTITVSPRLIPDLEKTSGQKVIDVVPNGLYLEQYFEEEGITRDGVGTLFSTSMEKSPEDIIEIMQRLGKQNPPVPRYSFGADTRPEEFPEDMYSRFPSVDRARELYNRSKIWLVPSRSEGFGLPILEAMACGCAVICTNFPAASGLITHDKNGLIVPIGDVDAFMQSIELLLNDDAKRESLVQHGRETAQEYTWALASQKMEKVLESIREKILKKK
ncbi:MAG: glycosyltransferase family 4 protein [bacterium]|nr:glycosyltransferase family 4 protein [bacterium]